MIIAAWVILIALTIRAVNEWSVRDGVRPLVVGCLFIVTVFILSGCLTDPSPEPPPKQECWPAEFCGDNTDTTGGNT